MMFPMLFLHFSHPFSRLHEGDGMGKITKTKDLVKRLDELAQKLDFIAAVIFTLIDVKDVSRSKQQQPS